ncbi:MAG: hypothetical protein LUD41_06480 [Phascolarctobacterium sp.]|nr:hypothetical protein [Phascolarctobacterium sp.]
MLNKKNSLLFLAAVLFASHVCAEASMAGFSVTADTLDYDIDNGIGIATGHVVVVREDGVATADYGEFDNKKMLGVLEGHVVANRGDEDIACDKFVMYSDKHFAAIGNAMLTKEGKSLKAERVDYYSDREFAETSGGWASLTDADGSTVTAEKITYNMKDGGIINAIGGVNIKSDAQGMTGYADRVVYEGKNDVLKLLGNAKVTKDGNSMAGAVLRMTNGSVATGDGKVMVVYIPPAKPEDATDKMEDEKGTEKEKELLEEALPKPKGEEEEEPGKKHKKRKKQEAEGLNVYKPETRSIIFSGKDAEGLKEKEAAEDTDAEKAAEKVLAPLHEELEANRAIAESAEAIKRETDKEAAAETKGLDTMVPSKALTEAVEKLGGETE